MNIHETVLQMLSDFGKGYAQLEIPPKVFTEMNGEFIAFENLESEGASLSARFPFDPRFSNPAGMFQGGMICTVTDNVLGPLSYLAARSPTVTVTLDCKFVRPFMQNDKFITVEARVVSKTKQFLLMNAEVRNSQQKLVAFLSSQFLILS